MVPAKQDIKVMRGDTEIFNIYLKNDADTPIDITGDTFASQIRYNRDDATAAASFTPVIVDGPAGHVRLTLSSGSSAALLAGAAFWDCQRTTAGGVRTTFISGKCTILADVTR